MKRRALLVALVLASAPAAAETRRSLRLESNRAAWQLPGFRLGLGAHYDRLVGLDGAPGGGAIGAWIRPALRLDARWSLATSLQYAVLQSGDLTGMRFSGTVDPTWHVTPDLALAFGLGVGGIVESGSTDRADPTPTADELETSYTFPDARMPLPSCSGLGAAGLVRAEYGVALGPHSRITIAAELIGQWTGCVEEGARVEPDTGRPISRRQWWPHTGGAFSIGVTWR